MSMLQSTLPHGERLTEAKIPVPGGSFNPRSRTGSDIAHIQKGLMTYCFNPRSRTGSDFQLSSPAAASRCFNPRSRTGSDLTPLL